jgi:hypothetical protein
MRKIINLASEMYIEFIGSFVRAAQFNDKDKFFQIFDYYFFYVLINDKDISKHFERLSKYWPYGNSKLLD